jgi:hypothetical protein
MEKSEHINELATALAKAQGEMKGAHKDSENPFFKSKYADLAAVWEAIRGPFAKHGLSIVQTTSEGEKGLMLHTTLLHSSGQYISGGMIVKPVKQDPQGLGSALSYSRRYALSAIAGVYQNDDDANLASGKEKPESKGYDADKAYFNALPEDDIPSDMFPGLENKKTQTKDRVFSIGKDIKGKKFSEKISDPSFINWVKSEVEHNLAKCHGDLKDFYEYATQEGVIK